MRDRYYFFYFCLACFTTLLAFGVIVFGAYTRLTDAGLGCPDWPGCYGHWVVSTTTLQPEKAWTEMIHRYLAGSLGIMILMLALLAIRARLILPFLLLILVIFQALLGMWTVTLKLLPPVVLAHLLGGMTTLALLWWLVLVLRAYGKQKNHRADILPCLPLDNSDRLVRKLFSFLRAR